MPSFVYWVLEIMPFSIGFGKSVRARGNRMPSKERRESVDDTCPEDTAGRALPESIPAVHVPGFWTSRIGFAAENEAVRRTNVVMNRLKIIL